MVSQNIGNGTGMLYATDLAATKIISCTRNDAEGVRNMRTLGAGSAPIAAERSAVATVTFTAIGGAGNITAITIAGVNQIPSNVAATVGDPTQTATDVAAAINGYTPGSGTDFVANSVGGVLYIYSTPSAGQATNGLVVTVSVSNVLITFTKTGFAGGSSESGNTDSSVGLRFWLDPKGNAPRTSFASAEEITKYIVVRGLQTGIVTKTLAVNTGRLTGIDRSCAITQIFTDTQSSAATDDLDFIETVDFVEGDVIRLTQYVSGRVVTVTDASTSSGNIYLTNQSPFNCEDNKSIELRLQYDSTLGLIWIENGRSVSQGYVSLSRVEMRALISTGTVIAGQTYFIYDAGQAGIQAQGIDQNSITTAGQYIAYNPDYQNVSGDFAGVWTPKLANVVVNKLYAYNNLMYRADTTSTGTDPASDPNFTLIAITDPRYIKEVDSVQYNINSNLIEKREDKRGNIVLGSTAIASHKWGSDDCYGNIIIQGSFRSCNLPGGFDSNIFSSMIGAPAALTAQISGNTMSNVYMVIGLSGHININYNVQQGNSSYPTFLYIQEPIGFSSTYVSYINNRVSIDNALALEVKGAEVFQGNFITGSTLGFKLNSHSVIWTYINYSLSLTFDLDEIMVGECIDRGGSTYKKTIDLDTAMSGNTLIIPGSAWGAGVWRLTSATTKTINKMLVFGFPPSDSPQNQFPVTLTALNTVSVNIVPTAAASAVKGNIVSDAAGTFTIVGRTAAADRYQVQFDGTVWVLLNSKNYV